MTRRRLLRWSDDQPPHPQPLQPGDPGTGPRERVRDDSGVTLIELLVVIGILATVLGLASAALVSGFRTMAGNQSRLDATAQQKTAVESMTRSLRTAIMPSQLKGECSGCDVAAFISGDASSVLFYANLDNDAVSSQAGMTDAGPRRVSFTLKPDGTLVETITRPKPHATDDYVYDWCDHGSTGCAVRTRIIARDVAQSGTALFTYYDAAGTALPVPLASATALRAVDSIDLCLKVKVDDRTGTATTATRITLPNALSPATATPMP